VLWTSGDTARPLPFRFASSTAGWRTYETDVPGQRLDATIDVLFSRVRFDSPWYLFSTSNLRTRKQDDNCNCRQPLIDSRFPCIYRRYAVWTGIPFEVTIRDSVWSTHDKCIERRAGANVISIVTLETTTYVFRAIPFWCRITFESFRKPDNVYYAVVSDVRWTYTAALASTRQYTCAFYFLLCVDDPENIRNRSGKTFVRRKKANNFHRENSASFIYRNRKNRTRRLIYTCALFERTTDSLFWKLRTDTRLMKYYSNDGFSLGFVWNVKNKKRKIKNQKIPKW